MFQQLQKSHGRGLQELVADPPDNLDHNIPKLLVSLYMPFNPGPVKHSQPLALTLLIKTNLKTTMIIQLGDLTKLLLQIPNKLNSLLILWISTLEYLILMNGMISFKLF